MDSISAIYEETITPYVKKGLPDLPDLTLAMLDTNVWTNVAKAARQSSAYHVSVMQRMVKGIDLIVIPEIILKECAGSGRQIGMIDTRFNELYEPVFKALSGMVDIHVVTFTDMENMMVNSNGGKKDSAFRKALLIANELFETNSDVKAALATVKQFSEIEGALTVIQKDAGERVILFYTMLFLNEYWSVDVFTNEVEVYTDRTIIALKEKLREAIGNFQIEDFYEAFRISSYDVVLFDVLVEQDTQWSSDMKRDFVTQCRDNKTRKIRVHSKIANYANVEHCANNKEFLMYYSTWKINSMSIVF